MKYTSAKHTRRTSARGTSPCVEGVDLCTPLLKTFLGFIGIADVTLIGASGTAAGGVARVPFVNMPTDGSFNEPRLIDQLFRLLLTTNVCTAVCNKSRV